MSNRRAWVLLGFGFLAGMLACVWWSEGSRMPRAAAQAPAKAEVTRYQITSWAYPGFSKPNGISESPKYGAYVLDTLTGEVWVVKEDNAPRSVGKVGKP